MRKRYVGRVGLTKPSAADRGVARVRAGRRPQGSAGHAGVRGVASAAAPTVGPDVATPAAPADVDEPVDAATALLQPSDVTAAIFVDGSGRRGRRLRRGMYVLIGLALLLILAFWVVQGVDLFGSSS